MTDWGAIGYDSLLLTTEHFSTLPQGDVVIQFRHLGRFLSSFFVASFAFSALQFLPMESASANWNLACQDEDFEVGDLVEIEFLGDTYEGEITRFTPTGWPYVEFERRGQVREQFFPPQRITLLQPAGAEEASDSPGREMRTWTDATGKFEIEARLFKSSNGKIELEKTDGRVVTLALEKLSPKDQEFIAELEKKAADEASEDNPFAGGTKAESPFAGGKKPNRDSTRTRPNTKRRNTKSNPRSDRSRRRKSSSAAMVEPEFGSNEIGVTGMEWSVVPDGKRDVASTRKIISLGRSSERSGLGVRTQVAFDPQGKSMIAMKDATFSDDHALFVADLDAATGSEQSISGERVDLFAGSSNGMVVMKKKRRGDETGGLEFWDFSTGSAKSIARWKTADFFDRTGFDPEFGVIFDKGRLLTFGRRIVAWDIETASDIYTIDIPVDERPVFSPGGKQFAVASEGKIYIFEVLTGKTLGVLDAPDGNSSHVAFSDSGQFLVAGASGEYETIIWDLGTGKQAANFQRTSKSLSSLDWVGDEYVLVNGTSLIDVVLKSVVWDYKTDNKAKLVKAGDYNFYYVSPKKITPLNLLPKGLKEKTAQLDPDELLALKPGSQVAIKLSLPLLRSEIGAVRRSLSSMLTKLGYVVSEDAPNELVIDTKKMKSEKMTVSAVTDPLGIRGTEEINFSKTEVSIRLTKSGDTIWQHSYKRGPAGIITTERNESYQQAANRMCKVKAREFIDLKIPGEIRVVPQDIKGSSEITAAGVF